MTDYTQYINDYLSGNLSAEKTKDLKERLAVDKDLQDEFHIISSSREYLKARTTLDEIEGDSLLEEADRLVMEHFTAKENSQESHLTEEVLESCKITEQPGRSRGFRAIKWRYVIPLIASAAVLTGIFLIIRSSPFSDPNTKIYAKYYEPMTADLIELEGMRGGNDQNYYLGKKCYLEKDYICAIKYFSMSPELQFYLGLAHLGTENYEDALAVLSNFQKENPFHPGANWYLGLIYIRLNGLDMALSFLEKLMDMENIYQEDAQQLIRKIEKLKAAEAD